MKSNITLSLAKLGRGMKQRNGVRIAALSILLAAMAAAGSTLGLRESHAQSGGKTPDYSKVDDFLDGGTHLLHNDELVIAMTRTDQTTILASTSLNDTSQVWSLDPTIVPNGKLGCTDQTGCNYVYGPAGSTPFFEAGKLATGRFFNTDRDTTVQFPLNAGGKSYLVSLAGKTRAYGDGTPYGTYSLMLRSRHWVKTLDFEDAQ